MNQAVGRAAYRIRDWDEHFETNESRKLKKLNWVPVPTHHDSCGFRHVMAHERGAEIYTAWILTVQVAAKIPKPRTGLLVSGGRPLDAEDLAVKTGAPAEIFELAFEVLTEERIGWLETVGWPPDGSEAVVQVDPAGELPGTPAESPDASGNSPDRGRHTRSDPVEQKRYNKTGNGRVNFTRTVLAGSDRAAADVKFRNTFVLSIAEALGVDPQRTIAQRRPLLAVARSIQNRSDRDEITAEMVEIAANKRQAGMDNPAAAWQSEIDKRFPKRQNGERSCV